MWIYKIIMLRKSTLKLKAVANTVRIVSHIKLNVNHQYLLAIKRSGNQNLNMGLFKSNLRH